MFPRLVLFVMVASVFAGCSGRDEYANNPERLEAAVKEVKMFGFEQAYDLFVKVVDQSEPGSQEWQQAVFGAGACIQQVSPLSKSNVEEAERLYKLLLAKSPESKFAPRAMLNLGRIVELSDYNNDVIDLQAARGWYQKVVDDWCEKPVAGEATLRIAGTYIQTYEEAGVRKGIKILVNWLAKYPNDPLASTMWQYLGDSYFFPLKEYAKALDCYDNTDRIGFIEKGREGPAYWRMAVIADRYLSDRKRAVKYYTKIIKVVPNSGKAYEAQLALKRLGAPVPKIILFKAANIAEGEK